jgi:hypothetical protein
MNNLYFDEGIKILNIIILNKVHYLININLTFIK